MTAEMWAARQMSKPVESQVNQMGGNDFFGWFTGVEPGLPGHANHAGEGLGVQVGVRDIEPVTVKVGGENPLSPRRDVGEN